MPLEGFTPYKKEDAGKYTKFRWWPGITFGDMLDKAADVYPDKEALVDSTSRYTYSQLREKANLLAISLMKLGIKKQDRVLLQLPNWNEFIYSYFAVQKIGAIVVLLLARHAQIEIDHICRLTGATAWIVAEKYRKIDYLPIIDDVLKANPELKHVILVRSKDDKQFLSLEKLIFSTSSTLRDFLRVTSVSKIHFKSKMCFGPNQKLNQYPSAINIQSGLILWHTWVKIR